MAIQVKTLGIFVSSVLGLLVWNEFFVYHFVLLQCHWPSLSHDHADLSLDHIPSNSEPVKAMFMADTHIFGSGSHWFDRLRREWQMRRSFQTAAFLFNPEVIFVLGDLLDEGKWCSDQEFEETVARFQYMFGHHGNMQLLVGNHDIGFHYMADSHRVARFQRAFEAPSVRMLRIKDNTFVLLNSVAFEGDHCQLCTEAETRLQQVALNLSCSLDESSSRQCSGKDKMLYTKPIVLQHYPMYRQNDADCEGPDSAPPEEKYKFMKPKYDCLSEEATEKILSTLKPRLVIDAHTHHFCMRKLHNVTPEWTVPSFNWRNKNNPSFLLATINNNNFEIHKCYLPTESTVIWTYIIGGIIIVIATCLPKCLSLRMPTDRYTKMS